MEVQEEVEGFSRRRNQLEEKIHTLKNTLKEEERTHRKLEVEVKPMQDMIKELESQVPGQQIKVKEVKKCDAQIKEITGGKVNAIKKKRDEAAKKFEQFNSEITKLTVEIKGNQRNLKKVTDKIENMEAEIKECEESM